MITPVMVEEQPLAAAYMISGNKKHEIALSLQQLTHYAMYIISAELDYTSDRANLYTFTCLSKY